MKIESLLNYIGHKSKIIDTILTYLPETVEGTFYDIFAGSAVVGLNVDYPRVVCVEQNSHLVNLYQNISPPLHSEITRLITEYDLTNSSVTPRREYLQRDDIGTVKWHGEIVKNMHLDGINKPGYTRLLQDYNSGIIQGNRSRAAGYLLATLYGRNSHVGVRADNTLSGSPGPLDYSIKANKKFWNHVEVLAQGRHQFVCASYESVQPAAGDFCYFDPPYLASSFHYQGWDKQSERELLDFIDRLPCDWALSNSLQSGTRTNDILQEWSQDKVVIDIDKRYRKWAATDGSELAHRDSKVNREVLILPRHYRSDSPFEFDQNT